MSKTLETGLYYPFAHFNINKDSTLDILWFENVTAESDMKKGSKLIQCFLVNTAGFRANLVGSQIEIRVQCKLSLHIVLSHL